MRLPLKRGGLAVGIAGVGSGTSAAMVYPRWLARLWAKLMGYFWLPCPVCGDPFAGFEWGEHSMMDGPHAGAGVCAKPACQQIAKESSERFWASHEGQFLLASCIFGLGH